jgi:hypothetical protein
MFRQSLIGLGMLGLFAVSTVSAKASTDLRVVESAALGTDTDVPWSEPVQVEDPFEGEFVAVFDRHYFYDQFLDTSARIEVQSLWTPQSVRFLLTTRDRDCWRGSLYHGGISHSNCSEIIGSRKVSELFVRVNEQVFQVSGENSTFRVSAELAQALQTAPNENIEIRLVTESGETVDSEIGDKTVEAWKTIYAN